MQPIAVRICASRFPRISSRIVQGTITLLGTSFTPGTVPFIKAYLEGRDAELQGMLEQIQSDTIDLLILGWFMQGICPHMCNPCAAAEELDLSEVIDRLAAVIEH